MRPLDSADASLGVTQRPTVIPTGVTNGVRDGMGKSHRNLIMIHLSNFCQKKASGTWTTRNLPIF